MTILPHLRSICLASTAACLILVSTTAHASDGEAVASTIQTVEGAPVSAALKAKGDIAHYVVPAVSSNGTIVSVDDKKGLFTYTPNFGFVGVDSFPFQAIDKDGKSTEAQVSIDVAPGCLRDEEIAGITVVPASVTSAPITLADINAILNAAQNTIQLRLAVQRQRLLMVAAVGGTAAAQTQTEISNLTSVNGTLNTAAANPVAIQSPQAAAGSPEGVLVQGLADFLQTRAQAELQEVVIGRVLTTLCGDSDGPTSATPFFPATCAVNTSRNTSYLSAGHSYSAIVLALRSDLHNVAACGLRLRDNTALGYQLMSIYEQHETGAPLEQLYFGLATSGQLNLQWGTDSSACTYSPAGFKGPCNLILPIIAYAAALEVKDYVPKGTPATWSDTDLRRLLAAYSVAWKLLLQRNDLGPRGSAMLTAAIQDRIQSALTTTDTTQTRALFRGLQQFYELRGQISNEISKLNDHNTTRDDAAAILLNIGQQTLGQLIAAYKLASFPDNQSVTESLTLVTDFEGAYSAFEAKEYVTGVTYLDSILDCLEVPAEPSNRCAYAIKQVDIGVSIIPGAAPISLTDDEVHTIELVSGAAAALAEAKSADDFSNTLNALASPIDSWKLRQQQDFSSIQAFVGFTFYTHETDNIPGYPSVTQSYVGESFIPIGYAHSWVGQDHLWGRGTIGYFISILDVGNIIHKPRDITFSGGTVTGQVENKLSDVFEPGAILFWAPFESYPFVFGAGYSFGPADYRTIQYTSGKTGLASRTNHWVIFISMDVPIFVLN